MTMQRLITVAICAVALSFPLAAFAGVAPDTDGDTVVDVLDNCSTISNASPADCDGDNDGFGNACDCDINNDSVCDTSDIPPFRALLTGGDPSGIGDINCDTATDTSDIPPFRGLLTTPGTPGPSGLSCAGTVPCP